MKENMRILCIDFDDTIFKTKPFVEEIVEKIDYMGSERYLMSIEHDSRLDKETKRILSEEHFEHKDQVLEEVFEEYVGLIDYDRIFAMNEIHQGAIEYVNYLYRCGRYDKVFILTHYNIEREVEAKKVFINKYFPGMEVIAVPFHKDKYEFGKKRKRSSKAEYLMEYLGLSNILNCTLIDDSPSNGRDWILHGGNFIQYNPNGKNDLRRKELATLFPFDVLIMSDDNRPKLGRGK